MRTATMRHIPTLIFIATSALTTSIYAAGWTEVNLGAPNGFHACQKVISDISTSTGTQHYYGLQANGYSCSTATTATNKPSGVCVDTNGYKGVLLNNTTGCNAAKNGNIQVSSNCDDLNLTSITPAVSLAPTTGTVGMNPYCNAPLKATN